MDTLLSFLPYATYNLPYVSASVNIFFQVFYYQVFYYLSFYMLHSEILLSVHSHADYRNHSRPRMTADQSPCCNAFALNELITAVRIIRSFLLAVNKVGWLKRPIG